MKNLKGSMLVELLVTSLIMVIALTGTTMYITQATNFNSQVISQANVKNALTLVSRRIGDNVRTSSFVEVNANQTKLFIYDNNETNTMSYLFENNKLYGFNI